MFLKTPKMTETKRYKCVNCGEPAAALYKTYGPNVLKLTKCEKCKDIVDKYIEYDPVIVIIDLVLMSKEAQRHILYNTDFKSYWKLLIILMMLETYGVWRSDSLFNIGVNIVCNFHNSTPINNTLLNISLNISVPDSWGNTCDAWAQDQKADESDLFIWEKEFYIKFISIFAGIAAFVITLYSLMKVMQPLYKQEVTTLQLLKAFSLANVSILLTLPMLVWGTDSSLETRTIHYLLVFLYSFVVFLSVFTVSYECPMVITIIVLVFSNIMKYATSFQIISYMKTYVT